MVCCKIRFLRKDVEPEQYIKAKTKSHDTKTKRFIITWAQNNTPVHKGFFIISKKYASFIHADIHVIAGRYKTPRVFGLLVKSEEYWAQELLPF
jgi:hypothetical protein